MFLPYHLFLHLCNNHQFQAKIQIGNWILIAILLATTIYFIWIKSGILIGVSLVLLILIIERSIHTEYRLNKEELVIHKGRLSKDLVIGIKDIKRVERIRKFRIGNKALMSYLLIIYGDEKNAAILPDNEKEFINQLMKIKGISNENIL